VKFEAPPSITKENASASQDLKANYNSVKDSDVPLAIVENTARGNLNKADAVRIIKGLGAGLDNIGKGSVMFDGFYRFPSEIQQIVKKRPDIKQAPGFLHNDKIYLNLSFIPDRVTLKETYLHEIVKYCGFRKLFGQDFTNTFLKNDDLREGKIGLTDEF